MHTGILEIVGFFLVVAGVVGVVAAAALVSTALAVLVSGFFLVLAGVLAVYVAVQLEARAKAAAAARRPQP